MLRIVLSAGLACHEFQQGVSAEQLNEQTGPAEAQVLKGGSHRASHAPFGHCAYGLIYNNSCCHGYYAYLLAARSNGSMGAGGMPNIILFTNGEATAVSSPAVMP